MADPELLYIPYSPWSIRAVKALEHHRVPHRRRAYLTMLGEVGLRLRLGRFRGQVSVPVLFDAHGAVEGSLAIARWAEREGEGAPLFPRGREAEIFRWNERSDAVLDAGRARTTARVTADPEALIESLPPPTDALGATGLPIAKLGARFLAAKYGMSAQSSEAHLATMREHLDALSEALDGREHLVGESQTYADVTMAVALAFVRPSEAMALGPRSRQLWTEPELAERYAHLVAWRDRVLA